MNQARQKLIDMVKGGMAGYWVERLHSDIDNKEYYRLRHGADYPPLLCIPKEGIRLTAIHQGLSDEEIESLQIIDSNPNSNPGQKKDKWLPISLYEMVCLDKWASWGENEAEDRKRYNECLKTIDPELLPYKSVQL